MTVISSFIKQNYGLLLCGIKYKKKKIFFLSCRFYFSKNLSEEGPYFVYRQKLLKGHISSDYKQVPVIETLQEVYKNIKHYSPGKLLTSKAPKGLYIYGSVGAGKTMLMDIFYESVKIKLKRRTHFNNFMTDVHNRIHKLKSIHTKEIKLFTGKSNPLDPINPIAKQLINEAWLLCLDEFQVTDIADAMILKRMFTEMFKNGMVMVATSNRAPDDLYKNGLQRSNFVPFISVLKNYCNIASLTSKDYRVSTSDESEERYLISGKEGTKFAMDSAFKKLCIRENKRISPRTFLIFGHKVTFNNTCGSVLYVSFKDLCGKPLSSADYIQVAQNFKTVLIRDVPMMTHESLNQAKRFTLLIDTLYDNKVKLMLSAAAKPQHLFSTSFERKVNEDHSRIIMDDLNIKANSDSAKDSFFSISEETFAFKRTVSRIQEMCSQSYWNRNQ